MKITLSEIMAEVKKEIEVPEDFKLNWMMGDGIKTKEQAIKCAVAFVKNMIELKSE